MRNPMGNTTTPSRMYDMSISPDVHTVSLQSKGSVTSKPLDARRPGNSGVPSVLVGQER
jgi:hypothetical protein